MAKKPTEYIEIEVDGKVERVPKQQYLLWSLRDLGYDVPHFCGHKWLEPFGGCRMCLVKIETERGMMPKLQISCATKPMPGMKIHLQHPEVIQARKEQLEFHLLNHPLECPVCDKGGECMLQDQTMDHGLQEGRYTEQKKVRPDAVMNKYIRLNYKRCIHCKRCINYCTDIDGSYFLQFVDRGASTYIDSFQDPSVAPRFTGNVIDMCPVGALTARNYRFIMGRPWEQELIASVGSLDSVGSNIWVNGRLGDIARIIPRDNEAVENGMLDDVTRFSWEHVESRERVTKSIIRTNGETKVSRHAGEQKAARILLEVVSERGANSVGLIAGGKLNTEEYLAAKDFVSTAVNSSHYHLGDELFGESGPEAGHTAMLCRRKATIDQILNADTVVTIGCDLFEEAPVLGLRLDINARRGLQQLINLRSHSSEFDRFASITSLHDVDQVGVSIRQLTDCLAGKPCDNGSIQEAAKLIKSSDEDCVVLFGDEVWKAGDPKALIAELEGLRIAISKNAEISEENSYLTPVFPQVNSAGALLINHLRHFAGEDSIRAKPPAGSIARVLDAAAQGELGALVIIDWDLLANYPDRGRVERALAGVDKVIYCGAFENETSRRAIVHLPLGTWAHKSGSVLSLEWRLQRRNRASIDSVAPSLLDILNSISVQMEIDAIAESEEELFAKMREYVGQWPIQPADGLASEGFVLDWSHLPEPKIEKSGTDTAANPEASKLRLIHKRYLYSDREEIFFSPVFSGVPIPNCAVINPTDAEMLGIASSEKVVIRGEMEGSLEVQLVIGDWVKPGHIILNDYLTSTPANSAGRHATPVEVKVLASVREESE